MLESYIRLGRIDEYYELARKVIKYLQENFDESVYLAFRGEKHPYMVNIQY